VSDRAADVVRTAEAYYDSVPADAFYRALWGGEDIHIGLYEGSDEAVREASHRTVQRMASLLEGLRPGTRVLDMGAGYGGAARHLARSVGCRVTCLNLSEVQNETNRRLSREQGLDDRVKVRHGNFEEVPEPDASFDVVWSQDALLHSGRRRKVLEECWRLLVPGGQLIFTDPMQADDCPPDVLRPVYDRLHLDSLGSFAFYRKAAADLGFEEVRCVDLTAQLRHHYARVREELARRYDDMLARSGREYVDRMLQGLQAWVDAADAGHLAWGILQFRRPA
jgi:cyclopropane fatty-acyl-phospholipid synthase-like methyltransferase